MSFILAAALCSVCVSILLKIAKQKGYQPLEMITWNYLSASVLCGLWFEPQFSQLSWATPWWLIVSLGFYYRVFFYAWHMRLIRLAF